MTVPVNLQDVLTRLDTATTAVATRIRELTDRIRTGMTQEDVTFVTDQLGQLATHLEAMAHDPDNPVPPAPAPTVATTKKK
jgi:hypothetical protein